MKKLLPLSALIFLQDVIGLLLLPFILLAISVAFLFRIKWLLRKLLESCGLSFASKFSSRGKKNHASCKVFWLHAASVGETVALIPIIKAIIEENAQVRIILTMCTHSCIELVEKNLLCYMQEGKLVHCYMPIDSFIYLWLFYRKWRPKISIISESEIWPRRITFLARRGVKQFIVNASMSEKSYKKWLSLERLSSELFNYLQVIICQNTEIARCYSQLTGENSKILVSGNLKAEVKPMVSNRRYLELVQFWAKNRQVFLAISTHEGEENIVLDIYARLKKEFPRLAVIIAPRSRVRFKAVAKIIEQAGLKYIELTKMDEYKGSWSDIGILLGNTIGDIAVHLTVAQMAFVGKSLCVGGGHNPMEPALMQVPIITGHLYDSFKTIYDILLENQAAIKVENAEELLQAVRLLLLDSHLVAKMVDNSRKALDDLQGAVKITMTEIRQAIA